MHTLRQGRGFLLFNAKRFLPILKDNFLTILLVIFLGWWFYLMHMDAVKHASDKYISFSEAWDNLTSNKYMHIMQDSCDAALDSITKAKGSR